MRGSNVFDTRVNPHFSHCSLFVVNRDLQNYVPSRRSREQSGFLFFLRHPSRHPQIDKSEAVALSLSRRKRLLCGWFSGTWAFRLRRIPRRRVFGSRLNHVLSRNKATKCTSHFSIYVISLHDLFLFRNLLATFATTARTEILFFPFYGVLYRHFFSCSIWYLPHNLISLDDLIKLIWGFIDLENKYDRMSERNIIHCYIQIGPEEKVFVGISLYTKKFHTYRLKKSHIYIVGSHSYVKETWFTKLIPQNPRLDQREGAISLIFTHICDHLPF